MSDKVYVVVDKERQLIEEPNEFVTFEAAFMRHEQVPDANFIPVSWEQADRLKNERRDRLYPPQPEFCMHCGQEILAILWQ